MKRSLEVNIRKIRSLDENSNSNCSKNKRPVLVSVLFPIVLVPFIVSCQSGVNQSSANLYLSPSNATLANAKAADNSSALQSPSLTEAVKQETQASNSKVENKSVSNAASATKMTKAPKANNNFKKVIVYAPSVQTQSEDDMNLNMDDNSALLPSDEIDDSENLISTSSDDALSANNPNDPVSGIASNNLSSTPDDSLLLCEDNVYYDSWQEQFDNNWLAENGKNYKSVIPRTKALAQARTSEFIKIVYPSIEKTGFDFPVVINNQVLQWVNYFRNSGKKSFSTWLTRGRAIIPEMEKTLEKYGLPKDLVYLSMIESGYSSKALSYAGAVGPWQFMPATARENGLKINDYVDERRDIKKSTKAAANYLSDLYAQFGSWHLAAASYNGGPGLVRRTLKNYGTDSSFFQLTSMGVVNRETADYVPKLIAAMIISKNPEKFGFDTTDSPLPPVTKTIALTRSVSISELAKSLKIDKSVLDALNPELRLGITPPPHATSGGEFELEVPASKYENALLALNTIPDASNKYMIAARIKRRETVAAFAARYRLNTSSVLSANANLKMNSHLHKGQVVYIPVSLGSGQYDRLSNSKFSGSKKMVKKSSSKHMQLAHNTSSKKKKIEASKTSSKKSKSFAKAKKQSSSVALRKKSVSNKKVAISGQKKKPQRSAN
jgi:membrane-bound lytic murein transglycosylase D